MMSIVVKGRRFFLRWWFDGETSSPYISGDLFKSCADFVFNGSNVFESNSLKSLIDAKVIFCKGDLVNDLLSFFPIMQNARVLIIGNSDEEFFEPIPSLPRKLNMVLMQNMHFKEDKYVPIPIGLENISLAYNGFPKLVQSRLPWEDKRNQILIGPFSNTHPERKSLMETVDNQILINLKDRLSPVEYAKIANEFKFIACPRGNGIDTHRFWETIYRGSVPIALKTSWLDNFGWVRDFIFQIDNWHDLLLIDEKVLGRFSRPSAIPGQMWWPWWKELISQNV